MRDRATQLLVRATRGDQAAVRGLAPLVYDELRALARHYLPSGGAARTPTLQPTALVHEAFLRLIEQDGIDYQGRTHFLATAAVTMRCVLLDHVKAQSTGKRGHGWCRITLDDAAALRGEPEVDFTALDEALGRLAKLKERAAKVVELRFFGGMNVDEVAEHLGISARTVKGDWRTARAWLRAELAEADTV